MKIQSTPCVLKTDDGGQCPGVVFVEPDDDGKTLRQYAKMVQDDGRPGGSRLLLQADGGYKFSKQSETSFQAVPVEPIDRQLYVKDTTIWLTVPGASEAELMRGVRAAWALFDKAGVSPCAAAMAAFNMEGNFYVTDEEREWGCLWFQCQSVAYEAVCAGWPQVPSGCNIKLEFPGSRTHSEPSVSETGEPVAA